MSPEESKAGRGLFPLAPERTFVSTVVAQRDLDAFRRAAHSLKSNTETLGATSLAALARELEHTARAGSLDGTASRVERLMQTCELVAARA
jgi:HPt (histidine-containing phosphotransfer) domain-containing protein